MITVFLTTDANITFIQESTTYYNALQWSLCWRCLFVMGKWSLFSDVTVGDLRFWRTSSNNGASRTLSGFFVNDMRDMVVMTTVWLQLPWHTKMLNNIDGVGTWSRPRHL